MPQLIGTINDLIEDEKEIEFAFVADGTMVFPNHQYVECKEQQWDAKQEGQNSEKLSQDLLIKYDPRILKLAQSTQLDVHLIINSPGGNTRVWRKYDRALKQLRSEGATITAHTLTRAEGLAADIFLQAQQHTALANSSFAFTAGDIDDIEYMSQLFQDAATDNMNLTPWQIQHLVINKKKRCDEDWGKIKQFLLAKPEAIGHEALAKSLSSIEKDKQRQFDTTGIKLFKAGVINTTHSTVKEMFDSFCEQTRIPFEILPINFISESFIIAAVEEKIKQETGINVRLSLGGNLEIPGTMAPITTESDIDLGVDSTKIEEIIQNIFLAQEYARLECDN